MSRSTQIFLSALALLAIGMNLYAMFTGKRIIAVFSVLGVMPLVAILTLAFMARAQRRELERRFPGDGRNEDESAKRENSADNSADNSAGTKQ